MAENKAKFRLVDFKIEHSHFDINKDNIKEGDTDYRYGKAEWYQRGETTIPSWPYGSYKRC